MLDRLMISIYFVFKIPISTRLLGTHALGVVVDFDALTVEDIWKDSISPGVRLNVPFSIGNQHGILQVDIAVGDPLCRPPITKIFNAEVLEPFPIRTVVLEIAVAWKFHGLFEHLNGPWQSKTLWDVTRWIKNYFAKR